MKKTLRDEIFRKLIHLSSLWMVAFIAYFDHITSIIFFSILFLGFMMFEYARMQGRWLTTLLNKYFSFVMRDHERVEKFDITALTGSFYFLLAVLIDVILFDKPIAIIGILVMILSDTTAALVGKSMGKHRAPFVPEKTIEGAIGYFIMTCVIILLMAPINALWIFLIAVISTLTETYSHKFHINDNLSITLVTSGLVYLATVI